MIIYKKNITTNEYMECMSDSIIANEEDWINITEKEWMEYRLPYFKIQKITECKAFYNNLRFFNVTKKLPDGNNITLELKAEQNLTDAIQSWINELSSGESQYYDYLGVKFTLDQCQGLLRYISKIRNFCAKLSSYYCGGIGSDGYIITNINTYQELQSLDYKQDPFNGFKLIDVFPPFNLL